MIAAPTYNRTVGRKRIKAERKNYRLAPEAVARLDELTEATGKSETQIVEDAIAAYKPAATQPPPAPEEAAAPPARQEG